MSRDALERYLGWMPGLVSTGEFHECVPVRGDRESAHSSSLCLFASKSEMGGGMARRGFVGRCT